MEDKETMRRSMVAMRKRVFDEAGEAAAQAVVSFAGALMGLSNAPSKAKRVAIYLPMGGEMNPLPLAQNLRADGHEICLPVCIDDDAPMLFRRYKKRAALLPDAMGIPAPRATARTVTPHIVICPLLAFDAAGNRLGRGGGFYDRSLADLRAKTDCRFVGLAFDEQKVDKCPVAPHDEALHGVLTPSGLFEF